MSTFQSLPLYVVSLADEQGLASDVGDRTWGNTGDRRFGDSTIRDSRMGDSRIRDPGSVISDWF